MKGLIFAMLVAALAWPESGNALFAPVETEKVPIDRLIANLEKQLKDKPDDLEPRYALARVHSMAYALKQEDFGVVKQSGKPFLGHGTAPELPPRHVLPADKPEKKQAAQIHLAEAIKHYTKATELSAQHLPSQLGLGWCHDQAGNKTNAIAAYRKALDLAWKKEKDKESFFEVSMTEEIGRYLLPLLDPEKGAAEIARIKEYDAAVEKKPRAVTPLLIPLTEEAALESLVNPDPTVSFDLDGSGLPRRWGWITPKAGWLVYDHDGRGQITSGLQLAGSVTFWIFWKNGYHALAALDNDSNGWLEGNELKGLAIWRDANTNGISDEGEVRSLTAWDITALSCKYEIHRSGIPFNAQGVRFGGGTVRPTFDWIARDRRD